MNSRHIHVMKLVLEDAMGSVEKRGISHPGDAEYPRIRLLLATSIVHHAMTGEHDRARLADLALRSLAVREASAVPKT